MISAAQVIETLCLEPLTVEGGFFRELYRSASVAADGERRCGTSIYYLMRGRETSSWHQVASDEIWYYHAGSPAAQLLLFPDGHWEERTIGPSFERGQVPQSVIPAGTWQAAVLLEREASAWGLFGAAVFPGFEYVDFRSGEGRELAGRYPGAAARMSELGLIGD